MCDSTRDAQGHTSKTEDGLPFGNLMGGEECQLGRAVPYNDDTQP